LLKLPVSNTMVNIMPYNCRYCIQGFLGMVHVSNEARNQGIFLTELQKQLAEYAPVRTTLQNEDPIFVNGFGHGNNNVFTGDSETPIFLSSDCDVLSGRIVYLLSCLTANGLGPAIIANGGIAYGGYNISWTWMANDVTVDPYTDWYADGFYRASNEFPIGLEEGETVSGARDGVIAEHNRWINIWSTERASDPSAAAAIKWHIHDRDGLTILGDLDAVIRGESPEKAVLTVESEPIPLSFVLDDVEYVTPWTGEIAGGLHTLNVPSVVKQNSTFYVFRHWENGSTNPERKVWLVEDSLVKATYEQCEAHTLTINSEPNEITFYMNGIVKATPLSELTEAKAYTLKFPKNVEINDVWYGFDHWEDGSTNPERTIDLASDLELTATYKQVALYEVEIHAWYMDTGEELTKDTFMYIDDNRVYLPANITLLEGKHLLKALDGISHNPRPWISLRFHHWEDGTGGSKRELDLTGNMLIELHYKLVGGILFFHAKNTLNEQLKVPFTLKGIKYVTPEGFAYQRFGTYQTIMPEQVEIEGKLYEFVKWEDDSTNPDRNVEFYETERMDVTAYYKEVDEIVRKGKPSESGIVSAIIHPRPEEAEDTTLTLALDNPEYISGETIAITGTLKFTSDGVPLDNRAVDIYQNGVKIGSITTTIDGSYTLNHIAPEVTEDNTYNYQAKFMGDA